MNNRVEPTRYRCPKCGSDDLRAEVVVVTTVMQDNPEREPYPIIEDLDLGEGFNDKDMLMCNGEDCDYTGQAWEFRVKEVDSADQWTDDEVAALKAQNAPKLEINKIPKTDI